MNEECEDCGISNDDVFEEDCGRIVCSNCHADCDACAWEEDDGCGG